MGAGEGEQLGYGILEFSFFVVIRERKKELSSTLSLIYLVDGFLSNCWLLWNMCTSYTRLLILIKIDICLRSSLSYMIYSLVRGSMGNCECFLKICLNLVRWCPWFTLVSICKKKRNLAILTQILPKFSPIVIKRPILYVLENVLGMKSRPIVSGIF